MTILICSHVAVASTASTPTRPRRPSAPFVSTPLHPVRRQSSTEPLSMPTSRPRRSHFKPNPLALLKSLFSHTPAHPKPVTPVTETDDRINDYETSYVGLYVWYLKVHNLTYFHVSVHQLRGQIAVVTFSKRLMNHLRYVLRSNVTLLF